MEYKNESEGNSGGNPEENERPLFAHKPWMVGLVLAFGVLAVLGGFSDPIWLLLGAPFILALALYIYVQIVKRIRGEG
jgi:hypothetical protein